jgi:raffinose/stachyose/melibiose transport system permease protein
MSTHKHSRGYLKNRIVHTFKMAVLVFFACQTIFPFYWLIQASFKQSIEIYTNPLGMPKNLIKSLVQNYESAWTLTHTPVAFSNSLLYSVVSIIFIILITSMVSYVIARVMRGKWLFILFSFGIMIPMQALIIPLNIVLKSLGIINTRMGVIVAFIASNLSFSVFIIAAFMKGIPGELEDAAAIDGCSRTQTFFRIIIPISTAALATSATFCFINCWNDLLLSMTILQTTELVTLNLAIYNLHGEYGTDFGAVTAGIVMLIVPAMIIYLIFQKQIIRGMISGAVKG